MSGHVPALCREIAELLITDPGGIYVDATVGLGGHAGAILNSLSPAGRIVGIDLDADALKIAAENLSAFGKRAALVKGNYAGAPEILAALGIAKVNGILFDLGLSSYQLARPERGFAFSSDGPLDMRFDSGNSFSAEEIVNSWPTEELTRIFREYGEERHSSRIAAAIARERLRSPIKTTAQLREIAGRAVPGRGRIDPATRIFQALRVAVNGEFDNLKKGLAALEEIILPGGRAAAISFHSLEDRIVKRAFAEMASGGGWRRITKKPVTADEAETGSNPRARSAKLRVIERTR